MSAFTDFVNLELPRRPALLTVAIAGYDGDPNLGGAPAILQGAPVGTYYLQVTPLTLWQKLTAGASTWTEATGSSSSGGLPTANIENLTVPVDYNLASAVDPPAGTVFTTQAEIDDFLTDNGTTAFKHLTAIWNALPAIAIGSQTFNLAAGIHRPRPADTTTAFDLRGKLALGVDGILVAGASSASWPVVSSLTGIAISSVVTASGNPRITAVGTPFTALNLRGKFVRTSNGFLGLIHDHDNSTLRVMAVVSPAPTPGTHTLDVVEPATILRNSQAATDTTRTATSNGMRVYSGPGAGRLTLRDFTFQPLAASFGLTQQDPDRLTCTRVVFDGVTYALASNSQVTRSLGTTLSSTYSDCAFLMAASSTARGHQGTAANLSFTGCLFSGGRYGVYALNTGAVSINSCAFDGIGGSSGGPLVADTAGGGISGNGIDLFNVSGSLVPEFRNTLAGSLACVYVNSGKWRQVRPAALFSNNACPLVRLAGWAQLNTALSGSSTMSNGAVANTDVGLQIDGPDTHAWIDANWTANGTTGDVRLNGAIYTYAQVLAAPGSSIFDSAVVSSIRRLS